MMTAKAKYVAQKEAFALFHTSSLLFCLDQFVKHWQMFLLLTSKGLYRLYPDSEKKKKIFVATQEEVLTGWKLVRWGYSFHTEPP